MSAADRYVLSRADGSRTGRALLASAKLPAELVERSLFGLLMTGAVRQLPVPVTLAALH